jgi:hypothetical protein
MNINSSVVQTPVFFSSLTRQVFLPKRSESEKPKGQKGKSSDKA